MHERPDVMGDKEGCAKGGLIKNKIIFHFAHSHIQLAPTEVVINGNETLATFAPSQMRA